MLEKLLVAVDESDHAARTLEVARELAEKASSQLRVLHVQELGWGARLGEIPLEEREDAQRIVQEAIETLQHGGVEAEGVIRSALTSRVAGEIADEVSESGCSGIVIGSRGLSSLEGALIGSTTHKVIHLTKVPVIVAH